MKKLCIVGDGEFAEIAYEYFTHDSDYEVVGFAVEAAYRQKAELFGLPIVAVEEVECIFPPDAHDAFVAVAYGQLNRLRTRLYAAMKAKGYTLATYVSSHAFVWRDVQLGDNCFIFEANVVQYSVRIGNNVVLWSGNHIGHQSVIEDNVFIASHAVVSGYCTIGESSFVGVNTSFRDHVKVGKDAVVGAGAVVVKDVAERQVVRGNPAAPAGQDSFAVFGVEDAE